MLRYVRLSAPFARWLHGMLVCPRPTAICGYITSPRDTLLIIATTIRFSLCEVVNVLVRSASWERYVS